MEKMIVQLAASFGGSMGFALLFHLDRKHLLSASLGGVLGWGVYLSAMRFGGDLFRASLTASAATALYAELLARREKAPATLFFIPGIVPLIPGSMLYYAMNAVVRGDLDGARRYSGLTVLYALSIAGGISLVWACFSIRRNIARIRAEKGGAR